jgi:hypothetical protein
MSVPHAKMLSGWGPFHLVAQVVVVMPRVCSEDSCHCGVWKWRGVLEKLWIWSCRRHVRGRTATLGKMAGCRYQIRRCDSTPEGRHPSSSSSIMSSCSALETCINKIWDVWHVACDGCVSRRVLVAIRVLLLIKTSYPLIAIHVLSSNVKLYMFFC